MSVVILRFEPGTHAPGEGLFALVGHFGEPTGYVCEVEAGEKLPLPPVARRFGTSLWYVEQPRESAAQRAA